VLLGEYGTQEPDGVGAVRKDADHVGAAADLAEDLIPAQVARRLS